MVTDIYYFLSIFVLFNQLKWVLSPKEMMKEVVSSMDIFQKALSNKDLKFTHEYKSAVKKILMSIFIVAWIFLGFFSQQWILFMFLTIFQFIIIHPISKLIKNYKTPYIFFHWLNSLIGFLSISFIVLNQYKLHIDFATPFMGFIIQFFNNIF